MKVVAVGIFILLLVVPPAVSQVLETNLIVPGVRSGRWTLDMTIADLQRLNGTPVTRRSGPGNAWLEGLQVFAWIPITPDVKLVLSALSRDGRQVLALTSGEQGLKTREGIGKGDLGEKIRAAYGNPTGTFVITTTGVTSLVYDELGATFTVSSTDGLIGAVWIFRARTGATIWNQTATPAPSPTPASSPTP